MGASASFLPLHFIFSFLHFPYFCLFFYFLLFFSSFIFQFFFRFHSAAKRPPKMATSVLALKTKISSHRVFFSYVFSFFFPLFSYLFSFSLSFFPPTRLYAGCVGPSILPLIHLSEFFAFVSLLAFLVPCPPPIT